MAFPLALAVLAAGGGALLLFGKPKPKAGTTTGGAVLVPSQNLPAPPGAVSPSEMPGGPPTVIVSPPGASPALTPQQQVTQALPSLVSQVQQALPQLFPQAATQVTQAPPQVTAAAGSQTGPVMTVPAPGATTVTPPVAIPAPAPVSLPQVLTQQLPQVLTNVINQAQQATQATPLQKTETAPTLDTNGTVALAKLMIDREAQSGWKAALKPEITAWQSRVGMTPDGKFGESGALRMAQEVGVLPVIRYWPASSQKGTEVPKYQQKLRAYADTVRASNPAHATALSNAAAFEVGFSYGSDNPAPIPASLRQGQADLLAQILTK